MTIQRDVLVLDVQNHPVQTPVSSAYRSNMQFARLRHHDFCDAQLADTQFNLADLVRAQLNGANLQRANFHRARLNRVAAVAADFRDANLNQAQCDGADFTNADLSGANLSQAQFCGAILVDANLFGVRSNQSAHPARQQLNFTGADLRGADLRDADLRNATLTDAQLQGARYNAGTLWPLGWNSADHGLIFDDHLLAREVAC